MFTDTDDDKTIYKVVLNHEEQYSIWPADRDNAPGWNDAGKSGPKAECLEYINEVWTDMRPLSLRKKMEEDAKRAKDAPPADIAEDEEDEIESLPVRLSRGDHPVEAGLRPERTVAELKASVDRGYVHVKFTDTRGGTELGVELDPDASRFDGADFQKGTGKIHVEGNLTLDYVKVRCIADIELESLAGTGRLVIRDTDNT